MKPMGDLPKEVLDGKPKLSKEEMDKLRNEVREELVEKMTRQQRIQQSFAEWMKANGVADVKVLTRHDIQFVFGDEPQ